MAKEKQNKKQGTGYLSSEIYIATQQQRPPMPINVPKHPVNEMDCKLMVTYIDMIRWIKGDNQSRVQHANQH